ncbi:E3 ubiquitin-protein ligase TTC3 [Eublepharis macularius]|uniref:RING-type E3 ubiquitin transferase n=1 Tax=Eublepharis macularius TaxID=481883 RepID=A0AA97J166_EUBMA|nr:E3 ubiquitin-protein ligase TTC3 [Eublepharis macularius]
MESYTFEAQINNIMLYGTFIKPCCALACEKFEKGSSKKYKPDDIWTIWCNKPLLELHRYCDVIKIYTFWPFLFECRHNNEKFNGDVSGVQFCELTLESLSEMETLEDVADLAKRFANVPHFIKGILKIGNEIDSRLFNITDAFEWLKYADDVGILQKLETLGNYYWPFLEAFFAEYRHYISKVVLEDYNLVEEFESHHCESCIKKSNDMKKKGNEEFAKENFDNAITSYTKAIELWPENHLLYGNRALCFLRTGQYKKALGDGKRSIILKPSWPKGHYRFCDALSLLGEHRKALEANEKGQELCSSSPEGIKDLIQQHEKLKKQTEEIQGVRQYKHRIKKTTFQKNSSESASVSNQQSKKCNEKIMQFDNHNHLSQKKHMKQVAVDAPNKEHRDLPDSGTNENSGKQKSRMSDSDKTSVHLNSKVDCQKCVDKKDTPCSSMHQVVGVLSVEKLKTYIKDGCTALIDHRFHNAEQSFEQLLNVLNPSELQRLNLGIIDYVVIIYGYATALLGTGQPAELAKAEDHFNKIIEEYQKVRFNCLAHYGTGRVYLRQNRFSEALDQFMKSKFMIGYKIVPGVLTWPTTSEVIEETRAERLQVMLEEYIEDCKFPPNPDAICRYQQCQTRKIKIYFSDPDFKGFIRVTCCEQCIVEFHVSCWKKLKATRFNDKNDKDFLQQVCFTPDCGGLISKIVLFNSSGIIKCEFEHKIKTKNTPRPIVKQKCSSSRNLKLKHEKKLRRKFLKESTLNSTKDIAEEYQRGNCVPKYDTHKGSVQKCLIFGDTVLQLIVRNTEKIITGVHGISKLLNELLSWWAISKEDYAMYSTSSGSSSEVMEELINYLIQKKNRVKTRIFIHVLSESEEVDPKLRDWMTRLNRNGLEASEVFFSRYAHSVLQLDLGLVVALWNETYGIKLDSILSCSPQDDNEVLSFFCNSAVIELRCFIWLLEQNREHFPSFHQFLDEYFDKMDNPFTVLKKQETETSSNNGIKVKNRNRKKPKESRGISVLSGGVGAATREEDNIFSEENALSFMNPSEPFRIPDYLYDQVEEFEALFNVSSGSSYHRMLDNYPDPTCENLYDYFFQILEEHGPMEIDSPLLIGEYEYFPASTHKIVEDAGGLKSFLLQSLRFIMMGDLIGLMKHAVILNENVDASGVEQRNRNGENYSTCLSSQEQSSQSKPRLNPAAKEFTPISHINKPFMPVTTDSVAISNLEYMTTSHSSFSPFVSTYSFSNQTTDTIAASLSTSELSMPSTLSEIHPVFLNEVPSDFPVITQISLTPDVSDQSNYIFASYDAYLDTDPEAISDGDYSVDNLAASDVQKFQILECILKSENQPHEQNLDQIEHHSNEAGCRSVTKVETDNKSVIRNNPRSRMIAIQVDHELTDAGVNTLPFHPYEMQQGDMLRMEKEHQVLQEQLKEANGKYEQLKCRSSEEISVSEKELKTSVETNKLAKKELDWFHTDLEIMIKRWQQGKKENQEGLKIGRSKIRKLTDTNEMYMRNIDEKEKQYKLYLDEFLEISNKFENEKVKMEELTKKSRNDYLELVKQAVAAEVSVLTHWKETELCKLHGKAAHAEATLKYLKVMNSCLALPDWKFQVDSLESFISDIKEEIGKAESQFEERICMVKNGVLLNSISKVEIAELELPSSLSPAIHKTSPINDPAILMYSAGAPHLPSNLLDTFSSIKDNSFLHSTVNKLSGSKTSHKNYHVASYAHADSGEALCEGKERPYFDKVCQSMSPRNTRRHVQDIQLQHNTAEEPAATARLDHNQTSDKPFLPQPCESIIDQLKAIFPDYTSSDFETFIKEVKVNNGNKLSMDELLNFILDHANKKKINSSLGKSEKPPSYNSGQTRNQAQKIKKILKQNMPSTSVSRPDNENKKKKLPPSSTQLPWKTDGGIAKSKWKNTSDATDNDPCVICHEELSMEESSVLDCGHKFHKLCIGPWIKQHSTCPTCRRHVLLPEDYPELRGRNRFT